MVSSEPTTKVEVTEKPSEPSITTISSEAPITTTPIIDDLFPEEENDKFDDNPFEYEEETESKTKKKG